MFVHGGICNGDDNAYIYVYIILNALHKATNQL